MEALIAWSAEIAREVARCDPAPRPVDVGMIGSLGRIDRMKCDRPVAGGGPAAGLPCDAALLGSRPRS
jgi:hypothetical protein